VEHVQQIGIRTRLGRTIELLVMQSSFGFSFLNQALQKAGEATVTCVLLLVSSLAQSEQTLGSLLWPLY
jgi:hypothetical protein